MESLSPSARGAWAESFLSACSPTTADLVLEGAREIRLGSGDTFYRGSQHDDTEKLGLVVEGLMRTFRRSPDGRQVTLRYSAPGQVIGLPAVLGRGAAGVEGQALVPSRVVALGAAGFRAAAQRDPALAWATAVQLAEILDESNDSLSAQLFLSVRSRVARHLLDLATLDGGRLVVRASHQELADSIGSVREVVSRTLGALSEDGCLAREAGVVVVTDPATLHDVAIGVA